MLSLNLFENASHYLAFIANLLGKSIIDRSKQAFHQLNLKIYAQLDLIILIAKVACILSMYFVTNKTILELTVYPLPNNLEAPPGHYLNTN